MKRKLVLLSILLLTILLSASPTARAAPLKQDDPTSGTFGDPNNAYLEYSLTGVNDFTHSTGTIYTCNYAGGTITFSGKAIVTVPEDLSRNVGFKAQLGDQEVLWPEGGGGGVISNGEVLEIPFNFSYTVPVDYPSDKVYGMVELRYGGEVSRTTWGISFFIMIPEDALLPPPDTSDDSGIWDEPDSWEEPEIVTPPDNGISIIAIVIGGLVILGVVGAGGLAAVWVIRQIKPTPSAPPSPPPPDDAWAQEWIDKGWVWSEAEDGFVPQSGAINDQGQVWYHPPWEQGGSYWIDKAEYDNIQRHLSQGHQWSDRYGWQRPGEIDRLNRERDARWQKFTDPAEIRRQQALMEQRIRDNIANTPLSEVETRIRKIRKDAWDREQDFRQRQFDYYNNRADRFQNLENGARKTKWVADQAIDILGMAPGGGRVVKYTYKFTTHTIEHTDKTGSLTKGVVKGLTEAGNSYLGDYVGDQITIPGVRNPTNWSRMKVGKFFRKAVKWKNLKQFGYNKLKDKAISTGIEQGIQNQDILIREIGNRLKKP